MKCIFLLSGENLDLARDEVLALAGTQDYWMFENILICDADFRFDRLAMTKKVYEYLFESSSKTLISAWRSLTGKRYMSAISL